MHQSQKPGAKIEFGEVQAEHSEVHIVATTEIRELSQSEGTGARNLTSKE